MQDGVLVLQQRGDLHDVSPGLSLRRRMSERVLGDEQFTGEVHQRVDPLDIHTQGPRRSLGGTALRGVRRGRSAHLGPTARQHAPDRVGEVVGRHGGQTLR